MSIDNKGRDLLSSEVDDIHEISLKAETPPIMEVFARRRLASGCKVIGVYHTKARFDDLGNQFGSSSQAGTESPDWEKTSSENTHIVAHPRARIGVAPA